MEAGCRPDLDLVMGADKKDINLVFVRQGLRSYISVDLCRECPRQDNKGCCGHYSPVFYPADLFFIRRERPDLIEYIKGLPRLTILDFSITVDRLPDGDDLFRCQFHDPQQGCLLPVELRESVCRHFVCPGIGWWEEDNLAEWNNYFHHLADYEIALNNHIGAEMEKRGLSLRNPDDWDNIFTLIDELMQEALSRREAWGNHLPERESVWIKRRLTFGADWKL